MSAPDKTDTKAAPPTKPCVCCGEVNHDGIPDRDLDGYVCKRCKGPLTVAGKALERTGMTGCVPHPHEPR